MKTPFMDRFEERLTGFLGSRVYIFFLTLFTIGWMTLNGVAWFQHWDPYPFILLNLVYSTMAAYQQAFILLVQNRQERRARLEAEQKQREAEEYRRYTQTILRGIAAHGPVVMDNSRKLDGVIELIEDVYEQLRLIATERAPGHRDVDGTRILPKPRATDGVGDLSPDQV